MDAWWQENIVEPDKLPLLLCLAAFIVTFLSTRLVTRLIRAGIGPFRNNVSAGGVHVHHAVPGIILLILGTIMALRSPDSPWIELAGILAGTGMSLILDEFALILHLQDVYWSNEGRVSVEMIGLAAAVIGFVLLGFSPFGVEDLTVGDVQVRLTLVSAAVVHFLVLFVCVLKGKYRSALIGCFFAPVGWWAAARLARPNSRWGRRYRGRKLQRALRRERRFQAKWDPRWRWLSDAIAGAPSLPDPPPDSPPEPHSEALPEPLSEALSDPQPHRRSHPRSHPQPEKPLGTPSNPTVSGSTPS